MGIDIQFLTYDISVILIKNMNISIISTYKSEVSKDQIVARKVSKVLLELAEIHLKSPDTKHFISEDGIEKLRRKLAVD